MKPTAWYDPTNRMVSTDKDSPLFTPLGQVWPLYPKQEWVGLTEARIKEIWLNGKDYGDDWLDVLALVRAFEAELKEKNHC